MIYIPLKNPPVSSAVTDTAGNYTARGIPTGSYKVYFYGNNAGYFSEWYNDKQDLTSADAVTVSAPGTTSGISAVLAREVGSIAGRVTNAGGSGIQNIRVSIYTTGGSSVSSAFTDAAGYYTAGGIPTGSCKVYFYGNNTGYFSEWYNDKQDLFSADEVTVTAAGITAGINAVLDAPNLTLTSPNDGNSWNRNSIRYIRWNAAGCAGTLKLTLWQNGSLIGTIADNLNPAASSYSWKVGAYIGGTAPLGTGYSIKIEDNGSPAEDASDAPFSIVKISVKAPNGGETWQLGSTQNITWVVKSISGSVRIVLLKDGAKVGDIVNSIDPALGTYSWTVGQLVSGTAAAGSGYQIQIREVGTEAGDRSDTTFSMTPP